MDDVAKFEPINCMNCGRCVDACPENLIPNRLAKFGTNGLMEEFEAWHGLECIECGSCTYVCPAGRRLTQAFKQTRRAILDARKKN